MPKIETESQQGERDTNRIAGKLVRDVDGREFWNGDSYRRFSSPDKLA
jgi:hypothetical protein